MVENFPDLMQSTSWHIQGMAWFLFVAHSQMQEERHKLKKKTFPKYDTKSKATREKKSR